jgi:hypothetical protein
LSFKVDGISAEVEPSFIRIVVVVSFLRSVALGAVCKAQASALRALENRI